MFLLSGDIVHCSGARDANQLVCQIISWLTPVCKCLSLCYNKPRQNSQIACLIIMYDKKLTLCISSYISRDPIHYHRSRWSPMGIALLHVRHLHSFLPPFNNLLPRPNFAANSASNSRSVFSGLRSKLQSYSLMTLTSTFLCDNSGIITKLPNVKD